MENDPVSDAAHRAAEAMIFETDDIITSCVGVIFDHHGHDPAVFGAALRDFAELVAEGSFATYIVRGMTDAGIPRETVYADREKVVGAVADYIVAAYYDMFTVDRAWSTGEGCE